MSRMVKTPGGWRLQPTGVVGETQWLENTTARHLEAKDFFNPANPRQHRLIINPTGAPLHFKPDGPNGVGAWHDIDLADPDKLQTHYTLTR